MAAGRSVLEGDNAGDGGGEHAHDEDSSPGVHGWLRGGGLRTYGTEDLLQLLDGGNTAGDLDPAIHDQGRSHHHAECEDLIQVGDLFEVVLDSEFTGRLIGGIGELSALSAAGAKDEKLHGVSFPWD
jgi:hypothetical protein